MGKGWEGGGRKDKVFVRANRLSRPNKLIKEEAMKEQIRRLFAGKPIKFNRRRMALGNHIPRSLP